MNNFIFSFHSVAGPVKSSTGRVLRPEDEHRRDVHGDRLEARALDERRHLHLRARLQPREQAYDRHDDQQQEVATSRADPIRDFFRAGQAKAKQTFVVAVEIGHPSTHRHNIDDAHHPDDSEYVQV